MNKTLRLAGLTALLMIAVGCGGAEPLEETPITEAPGAAPEAAPAGDGTILRLDPAFDALVSADAVIEKVADGYGFTE